MSYAGMSTIKSGLPCFPFFDFRLDRQQRIIAGAAQATCFDPMHQQLALIGGDGASVLECSVVRIGAATAACAAMRRTSRIIGAKPFTMS